MTVDVLTEIEIRRPRDEVSAFAADPANAPAWYTNIKAVEWETSPPAEIGSRIRSRAQFLGRALDYTYEVRELEPGRRLVMATAHGPFPMETTYTWEEAPDGATKMTLRNLGEPSGFAAVIAPVMSRAMRKANEGTYDDSRSSSSIDVAVTGATPPSPRRSPGHGPAGG